MKPLATRHKPLGNSHGEEAGSGSFLPFPSGEGLVASGFRLEGDNVR